MAELAFTKQFLSALNGRPLKFGPDHVDDPKTYNRPPHTLPKPPTYPPTKKLHLEDAPKISITLKTLRPPHINYTTPPLSLPTTTLLTTKFLLSQHTGIHIDKLKLLYKGKLLPDISFLSEIFGDEPPEAGVGVLNVMLMGGAVPKVGLAAERIDITSYSEGGGKREEEEGKKEEEESKKAEKMEVDEEKKVGVLEHDLFWEELKGWLGTKLGSGDVAPEDVLGVFREAWNGRK
ncbi:hypothetical protein BGX38DRAFT_1331939 [Terfezia claveryi]|nr:hypothetical protein BGX38DRAFT_1331939 [Terfezia claveryi]